MNLRAPSTLPDCELTIVRRTVGTSTVQVWRGASDDGDCWISAKGDYLRKNFDIKEKASGRTLASVRRKSMNLSNLLLEKDTYIIRCEPGVDTALMVFLVIGKLARRIHSVRHEY